MVYYMRSEVNDKRVKELCMNFILDCAFGQHEDVVTAAIDKAYVDMASHTLKDFPKDEYKKKWSCRYDATNAIRKALETYPSGENSFSDWHSMVVSTIENKYPYIYLHEGKAQKWLNMTIKYIFVLKEILNDDERLEQIKGVIENTDASDYLPPIDSFILKGADIDVDSWSKLDKEEYKRVMEKLGEDKNFMWELETWGILQRNIRRMKNIVMLSIWRTE